MSVPQNLLFTANSPGEIAGWLKPLVHAAHRRWPQTKITVILLPCTFASGAEKRVAEELEGVDQVIPARHYWQLLGYRLKEYPHAALIHLGGDLMYAAALAWRWHIPTWSYLWGRLWWDRFFQGYFIKNEAGLDWLARHHLPLKKAITVGDLVADSVAYDLKEGSRAAQAEATPRLSTLPLPQRRNLITFLPGSRLMELKGLAPVFLKTACLLKQKAPELEFQLLLSPFLARNARTAAALTSQPLEPELGLAGRLEGNRLVGPQGCSIELIAQEHLEHLAQSRLAITIPGTKTAQAACLGVPQLVILPLNRPEVLPFGGLLGLLDWLPGGSRLKGRLLMMMKDKLLARLGFLALPNILAKQALVPEIIEVITPELLAQRALEELSNPDRLWQVSQQLQSLYLPFLGAANRMLDAIEEH